MFRIAFLALFLAVPSAAFAPASASAREPGCSPSVSLSTLNPNSVRWLEKLQLAFAKAAVPVGEENFVCDISLPQLQSGLRKWQEAPPLPFSRIQKEEAAWLETMPDQGGAPCAEDSRLKERADFLSHADSRLAGIENLASEYENTLTVMKAERNVFAEKENTKRLLRCLDDLRRTGGESEDGDENENDFMRGFDLCLEEAGASEDLLQDVMLLDRSGARMAAGLSCLLDPKAEKLVRENLALTNALSGKLRKSAEEARAYAAWARERFPGYGRLTAALRLPFRKLACENKEKAERNRRKQSVRRLTDANESAGTGFIVRGAGGNELVSARHVGFKEGLKPVPAPGLKAGAVTSKGRKLAAEFPVSPGNYDRGNDIVKTKAGGGGKALEVARVEDRLKPGDELTLLGYPANRDFAFTRLTCKMLGIGRGDEEDDRDAAYIVHCPGAESHIAGMSGGPVLNQEGKVVGVISAHNFLDHHVIVRPLGKDEKGEIKMGFQRIFQASRCYGGSPAEPHPCQVIPGLTFEENLP